MPEKEQGLMSRASKRIKQLLGATALTVSAAVATPPTDAQAQPAPQHPNILFIMADDIGLMQVGAYYRGIALGETPNIERIGQERSKQLVTETIIAVCQRLSGGRQS